MFNQEVLVYDINSIISHQSEYDRGGTEQFQLHLEHIRISPV